MTPEPISAQIVLAVSLSIGAVGTFLILYVIVRWWKDRDR